MKTKTAARIKRSEFPERMTAHERILALNEKELRARGGPTALMAIPTDAGIGRVPDEGRRAIETMLESRHKAVPRRKRRDTPRVARRRPG